MTPVRAVVLAALAVALLGCQRPVTILVAPEAHELLGVVNDHLAAVERESGQHFVVLEALDSVPADVVYLGGQTPLPDALVPLPVANVASPASDSVAPVHVTRSGLILFWDLAGITAFVPELPPGTPDGARPWSDPAHGWPSVKNLVIAGGETDVKLQAWLGQSASTGAPPTTKMFQEFSTWLADKRWAPNAWRFTRADAGQSYQGGRGLAFVETFRDFYKANPPGFRRFFPLFAGQAEQPVLVGTALTLEARGSERAVKAAQAWAVVLTDINTQRQFSQKTGWMPGNLSAPVLETASALARKLLLRSARFTTTLAVTPAVRDQLQSLAPSVTPTYTPAKE